MGRVSRFSWMSAAALVSWVLVEGCGGKSTTESSAGSGGSAIPRGSQDGNSQASDFGGAGGTRCVLPELSDNHPNDLGIDFISAAAVMTGSSGSASISFSDDGELCANGTCAEGDFAQLSIGIASLEGNEVTVRDFVALGISQIRFEFTNLTQSKVVVELVISDPVDCYDDDMAGFVYSPGSDPELPDGTVTATLDALRYSWGDYAQPFDPTRILALNFKVRDPGDFRFCVSDIEFLDAQGEPVVEQ